MRRRQSRSARRNPLLLSKGHSPLPRLFNSPIIQISERTSKFGTHTPPSCISSHSIVANASRAVSYTPKLPVPS